MAEALYKPHLCLRYLRVEGYLCIVVAVRRWSLTIWRGLAGSQSTLYVKFMRSWSNYKGNSNSVNHLFGEEIYGSNCTIIAELVRPSTFKRNFLLTGIFPFHHRQLTDED